MHEIFVVAAEELLERQLLILDVFELFLVDLYLVGESVLLAL